MLDRAQPPVFNFQPASVNEAIHRAVTLARYQAAKVTSTHARRIKISKSSPIVRKLDAAQIEVAVVGRLNECGREDGKGVDVVIEVEDDGRGVPDENLSMIFGPSLSSNPNGAGLGLPSVRRITRAHGGRVEVTSTPGRGMTFTIRLPCEYTALEEKNFSLNEHEYSQSVA
ncbi:MAG: hypothetical protein J2P21_02835 [Chloracidobacterium sp.]|nr:hypothetical protein [Chloracidobacterium sp.]